MISNFLSPLELSQRLNKPVVLSSRQLGWNGILVEQVQNSPTPGEVKLPPLSYHWLRLPIEHPVHLTYKREDYQHEIVQLGDSSFIPAGQSSDWCCYGEGRCRPILHIFLKPGLIAQVAEASEMDQAEINLVNFSKLDLHLQHIATLFLAELKSGGMMGQLYIESLTQVLIIHLLRHYSTLTQKMRPENRSLTHAQLQQALDYIHTHLDQDLSLAEIARVTSISSTYFASLFKGATGISPHQYVIQQRVEKAKLMLSKTDLAITDIALQVGFSSQSHLTQQFKRLTGMTPKQVRALA
jgi:AraC family transcriptional regulator